MKAAVSRLEFAPGTDAMEVTDIERGRFVFPPRPDVPVDRARLETTVSDAGYEIETAWAEVRGTLEGDTALVAGGTGQRFRLAWGEEAAPPSPLPSGPVTLFGRWTARDGAQALRVERVGEGPESPRGEREEARTGAGPAPRAGGRQEPR